MSAVHPQYFRGDTLYRRRKKPHIMPLNLLRNLGLPDWRFLNGNFIENGAA
jgi:hypothetical protein